MCTRGPVSLRASSRWAVGGPIVVHDLGGGPTGAFGGLGRRPRAFCVQSSEPPPKTHRALQKARGLLRSPGASGEGLPPFFSPPGARRPVSAARPSSFPV
eukprot:1089578-Pyramimonas_sp.AAC.1